MLERLGLARARRKLMTRTFFGFLAALLAIAPASAHHGTATYDLSRSLTLRGSVTRFDWSNPHCLLYFDVTGQRGVQHWTVDLDTPLWLARAGWSAESLKQGDSIVITFHPVQNGSRSGHLRDEDGKLSVNGKELVFRLPGDDRIK